MPVRAGLLLLFILTAAPLVRTQTDAPPPGTSFDVTHYTVELDLDVDAGTIAGREQIDLTVRDTTASLVFDSGALVLDSITSSGAALAFVQRARRLIVTLPAPARAGDRRRLELAYHGAPRTGLTLLATNAQAYTAFSTSHWMVAVDAPADRATLELEVTLPAGWRAAGSGREV